MRARSGGFTLVELMVALAITGLVVAYLFGGFTSQHRTYIVVDELTQAQGNARAVAELMERELRQAGFKVPEQMAVCGVDRTNGPDTLYVSATDELQNVGPGLPLAMLSPTWAADVQNATPTQLTLDAVDIDGDGENDFDEAGVPVGGVIVANVDDDTAPVACGSVASVAGNIVDWTLESGNLPGLGDRRAVPAHRYEIVAGQLQRDGVMLIDDAEDLQLAWFFDSNDNDQVDPGETHGDGQGATGSYDPALANHYELRDVRMNLVVTTANPDPTFEFNEGLGQIAENRAPASVNGPDRLRRRLLTANVRVRNVGTR